MKILSINIRGFGGVSKIRLLRDLLRKESVDFLSVQKTGLNVTAERIIRLFWTHDEFGFCELPAIGRSGGLLSIWRKYSFTASYAFTGNGFLGVAGLWQGGSNITTFLNVYGPHDDSVRRQLWYDILEVHTNSECRCCLMGDFNVVRKPEDRKGSRFYQSRAAAFNEFILAAGLVDLKLGGRLFTWTGRGGTKLSKLDRYLISPYLLNEWTSVSVIALERIFADHCPFLLKSTAYDYGPSPFRFFDHWMQDEGFNDMLTKAWGKLDSYDNPMVTLRNKMKSLKSEIKLWRSLLLHTDVSMARKSMKEWELKAQTEELGVDDAVAFQTARAKYFEAEKLLSLSLKQKSIIKWAVDGDENNRFFHGMVRERLKKNTINGLSINGNWVEDPAMVKEEIFNHFKCHFSESISVDHVS